MSTEADKLVTFRLGEDHFAADIYSVERVLRYTPPLIVHHALDVGGHVGDRRGRNAGEIESHAANLNGAVRFGGRRKPFAVKAYVAGLDGKVALHYLPRLRPRPQPR